MMVYLFSHAILIFSNSDFEVCRLVFEIIHVLHSFIRKFTNAFTFTDI